MTPDEYDENGVLKDTEDDLEEFDTNNPQGRHLQNSNLTLHEYDFKNSKEKIVQEIYFRETEEGQSEHNRRQSTASRKDINRSLRNTQQKVQYNVTFSKQFGFDGKDSHNSMGLQQEYIDLIGFFRKQYCSIQQYTHTKEYNPVRIFRIHNEDKIGWMHELIDTMKPRYTPTVKKEGGRRDQINSGEGQE